jgi:hypothetical protein
MGSRQWITEWGLRCCLTAWLSCLPLWGAEAALPLRTVLLFDTSGSMRMHDPHRLSVAAAQLFMHLSRPEDAVGLVTFSDRAVPLVPLTPLRASGVKAQMHTLLQSLAFTGLTTDLVAALEAGLASFPPSPDNAYQDLVLFLTDGHLDLGRQRRAEEPAALAHIRQTLLPQYRQRRIALSTIAFTAAADQALLREMAQATQGVFRFITSAATLHEAFRDLFILARQAESVPMTNNALHLDSSVEEAQLIFSKRHGQEPIGLVTPRQERLHAHTTRPDVAWTTTPAYDLVQLAKPEPGVWQVDRPDKEVSNTAIVIKSPLRLHVAPRPVFCEAGEAVVIEAVVEQEGQRVSAPQRLQEFMAHADIATPQGEAHTLPLTPQEDGVFASTPRTFHAPGAYPVQVTVAGTQFRLQQSLTFTLHAPCFLPSVDPGLPVTVRVTLAETCPAFRSLAVEAEYTIENSPSAWFPLASLQPGTFAATLPPLAPGRTGQVSLRVRGHLEASGEFTVLKGPWPLPVTSPSPPATQWWRTMQQVLGKLLVLNGLLVFAGGGGYGIYTYLKRRRSVVHD